MKMEKLHIYKAIEKDNEDCCPRCEDVYYHTVGIIRVENAEYPVYFCPDCDIFYTTSDFDY